ncbi:MAG TPA: TadE/TadG family type IV pilus assembly protein [Mycobacteriales bacterium]|nr:TadE/TadG family type IV pilus assembly protein [Mycobacteriales bacterium]
MVEFLLVSILLLALLFAVVQVAFYLHIRNVVAASAAEGARYAANADRSAVDGGPMTHQIIADSLSERVADGMACSGRYEPGESGTVLVAVRCTGDVPLVFSWLGGLPVLNVTARALKEGG